jgi:hypothetical protein
MIDYKSGVSSDVGSSNANCILLQIITKSDIPSNNLDVMMKEASEIE